MKPLAIRLTILRLLAESKPYAVPFETLLALVNQLVRPVLQADELRKHLSALLDQGAIDYSAAPLDPDNEDVRKWFIREAGEVLLRQ